MPATLCRAATIGGMGLAAWQSMPHPTMAAAVQPAMESFSQGNAFFAQGRLDLAIERYDQALSLHPQLAPAWANRGVALHELKQWPSALQSHLHAVSLDPRDAFAWVNCGNTLREMGRSEDAAQAYDQAVQLAPNDAQALYARGNLLMDLEQPSRALADFDAAQSLGWQSAELCLSRGSALMQLQRFPEALEAFDMAAAMAPDAARPQFNRGCALNALGQPAAALEAFALAAVCGDDSGDLHLNRGCAFTDLDRWEESIVAFEAAIERAPESASAWSNLGTALYRCKAFSQARALILQPDYASARYNLSFLELHEGRLNVGFELYEARWKTSSFSHRERHPNLPWWQGEPLPPGGGLRVFAEQGYGDSIQFSRFVPLIQQRGWRVVLQVPRRLMSLFLQWERIELVADDDPLPPHVVARCGLMSLPHRLGLCEQTLPGASGYLSAHPSLIQAWTQRVLDPAQPQSEGPRVGLMWRGGDATRYRNRSLNYSVLAPLWRPGVQFISLQKDLAPEEEAQVLAQGKLQHHGPSQQGFEDAAALIAHCDLVITVDTSVSHLSGAMGKPTWILLPHRADWRWMEQRSDSPWYASVKLFRQNQEGDWKELMDRVSRALDDWVHRARSDRLHACSGYGR